MESEEKQATTEEIDWAIERIQRNKAAGRWDGGGCLMFKGEVVKEELVKIVNMVWRGWLDRRLEDGVNSTNTTLMLVGYKILRRY